MTDGSTAIGLQPWYYLRPGKGVTAKEQADFDEFASKVSEGHIPRFFRGHDFDDNFKLHQATGQPMFVVMVRLTTKAGEEKTGLIGYFNESLGDGMVPGTKFLETTLDLSAKEALKKGVRSFNAKESVFPIITQSSSETPEQFYKRMGTYAKDLKQVMANNKAAYSYVSETKKVNLLNIAGDLGVEVAYVAIPGDVAILPQDAKSVLQLAYEKFRQGKIEGKLDFEKLFEQAQKEKISLHAQVSMDSIKDVEVVKDLGRNRKLFYDCMNSLPDEYTAKLGIAYKKGLISESSYNFLKALNINKFYDTKFNCINDNGIELIRARTLNEPAMSTDAIGIIGADEIAGQITMKGQAFNFSLDITNLGYVNRKFGMAVGDIFIKAHIDSFNKAVKLKDAGKINDASDFFVKYYEQINDMTYEVELSRLTDKQIEKLKMCGGQVDYATKSMKFKIGELKRPYFKQIKIDGKMTRVRRHNDTGATAAVYVEEISSQNKRNLKHIYESHEKEVKNLKLTNEICKKGGLAVEVREYQFSLLGEGTLKVTLATVDKKGDIVTTITKKKIHRKPESTKAANNVLEDGSEKGKHIDVVISDDGTVQKFNLGSLKSSAANGFKAGAGIGLALTLVEHAVAGDDFNKGEVWIDVVKETGKSGGIGAAWSTLMPLFGKSKLLGGAGIGAGIELVSSGINNRKLYTSSNPFIREYAFYDSTWKIAKGGATGVVWVGTEAVFTVPSIGSGAVPGFFAATGASVETDYLLTEGGDWVSKKSGYEENYKVNVMKSYFKSCGIDLDVKVRKNADTPLNEAYFANMAYLLETNDEATNALKSSGIKTIKLDDVNNLTGTLLDRVVNEVKGIKDATVEITRSSIRGYGDNRSRGRVTEYSIVVKDGTGAVLKNAKHYMVEEEWRNPLFQSVQDVSKELGKEKIKLTVANNAGNEFYGMTDKDLSYLARHLSDANVSELSLDGIFRFQDGLQTAIEEVSRTEGVGMKKVAVTLLDKENGIAKIDVKSAGKEVWVLVRFGGFGFEEIMDSKGDVYNKYQAAQYGHFLGVKTK